MNETRRDFRLKDPLADLRQAPPSESASSLNEDILQAIQRVGSASLLDLENQLSANPSELAGRVNALVNLRLLEVCSEVGAAPRHRYQLSRNGERALAQHRLSVSR